jgi:hypothetical protein
VFEGEESERRKLEERGKEKIVEKEKDSQQNE